MGEMEDWESVGGSEVGEKGVTRLEAEAEGESEASFHSLCRHGQNRQGPGKVR